RNHGRLAEIEPTHQTWRHSRTTIGVVGQPNVDAILVMKAASRAPSQRHHVPQRAQSRRCSCGPLLEPMVAIWLPQRQRCGIRTFRPTMGESADDGADDGEEKKSSCSMCAALIEETSPARRRGYAQTKTPQWTARTALTRTLSEAVSLCGVAKVW